MKRRRAVALALLALAGCARPLVDPATPAAHQRECSAVASLAAQSRFVVFESPILKGLAPNQPIEPLTPRTVWPTRFQSWMFDHYGLRLTRALFPDLYSKRPPSPEEGRAYQGVLGQRRGFAGEYAKNLDCTAAFKAAGLMLDPGVAARDQLLLTKQVRGAGVESYSRAIFAGDGVMWLANDVKSCGLVPPLQSRVEGDFVTSPSTCGSDQALYRKMEGRWSERTLGPEGCLAVIRFAYGRTCPPP